MSESANAEKLIELEATVKRLTERVQELEKMAHPQHVMADPELSEAIKEMMKRPLPPIQYVPIPWREAPTAPLQWPPITVC